MTTFTVMMLIGGLAGVCAVNTLYYIASPLNPAHVKRRGVIPLWAVRLLQGLAYALSVLRLPYILPPYIAKVIVALLTRRRFQTLWDARLMQAIRLLGDFANFLLVTALLDGLPAPVYGLIVGAELVRLLAEKGQTVFSGLWQMLPHRGAYYILDTDARISRVMAVIDAYSRRHPEVERRMESFTGFEVVSDSQALRTGQVRDVARGTVFVHERWLNDPYLMIGLALRRSPWVFDPRFLRRPFYYRSQGNPLMTRFVLRCAPLTPPFAWYQFGHEIKAARFTLFFTLMRGLGLNVEDDVRADGSYAFDPLLRWVGHRLGWLAEETGSHLLTDEQIIRALIEEGARLSALDIARRFSYPLPYVEAVLLPLLDEAGDQAPVQ